MEGFVKKIYFVIIATAIAIPAIWMGRAALAYYADVSICFSPLKIVSYQDRIDAAVKHAKRLEYLEWIRYPKNYLSDKKAALAYSEFSYQYLLSIDPKSCCKVLRRAIVNDRAITFKTTLLKDLSHGVDLGLKEDPAGLLFKLITPTNICGNVVPPRV
jgi:hypothetical protein